MGTTKIAGRDLAAKLGVSPMVIANSARRLGVGKFESIQVLRNAPVFVLTEAEVTAVLEELVSRANEQKRVADVRIETVSKLRG